MDIGARLRQERERLGMTQEAFGDAGGVLKRALIHYEKGERMPDAAFLAGVSRVGADVHYIVAGQRDVAQPALDAAERVLLDSYRCCSGEARTHLIQTATLLAAGVKAGGAGSGSQVNSGSPKFAVQQTFSPGVTIGQQVTGDITGGTVNMRRPRKTKPG